MLAVPLRWEESGCSDLAGAAMGKIMEGNRRRSLLYSAGNRQGPRQPTRRRATPTFLFSLLQHALR